MIQVGTYVEWVGSISGILGALLIASNTRLSHWGWWLFLMSSVLMCVFAIGIGASGVLALNMCFVATNVLGIVRVWYPKIKQVKQHGQSQQV